MANPKRDVPATNGTADGEWEDIKVGLGDEWNFDSGPLVGSYLGTEEMELKAPDTESGIRVNQVHSFNPEGEDADRIVFVWGSAILDKAFEQIEVGARVRVTFLGIDSFKSDEGPRQIKRYRVQVARS